MTRIQNGDPWMTQDTTGAVLTRYWAESTHDSSMPMLHIQEPVVVLVCINHGMDGPIITTRHQVPALLTGLALA